MACMEIFIIIISRRIFRSTGATTELRFFSREMEKQYRESYSDPPEQNMKADGEVGGGGIAYERVANAKELLVIWVKYRQNASLQ